MDAASMREVEPLVVEVLSSLHTPIFKVKLIRRIIKKRYDVDVTSEKIRDVLLSMRKRGMVTTLNRNKDGALWALRTS